MLKDIKYDNFTIRDIKLKPKDCCSYWLTGQVVKTNNKEPIFIFGASIHKDYLYDTTYRNMQIRNFEEQIISKL